MLRSVAKLKMACETKRDFYLYLVIGLYNLLSIGKNSMVYQVLQVLQERKEGLTGVPVHTCVG